MIPLAFQGALPIVWIPSMSTRQLALLAFVLGVGVAQAQINSTSSLSGTITDSSGALVPGAAVVVENKETGTRYSAAAGANGAFTVPSLPAGTYSVTVTQTGFK